MEYFAGDTAPNGYIKANGAALSRSVYSRLFAAIGTTYGAGDGVTTFNVPDLRGEFLRGWDDGRGVDVGRALGSGQGDAQQNITGMFSSPAFIFSSESGAFVGQATWSVHTPSGIAQGSSARPSMTFDASRQIRIASEVRPRNRALLACIKY